MVFDKVYLVNLDSRPDRLKVSDCYLTEQGILYERFPAVKMDSGIHGLLETMKLLLKDAIDKKYSNICVLEDDFQFLIPNVKDFVAHVFPQVPTDYHLFYLGLNLTSPVSRISENILKVSTAYSTHAVCYSRVGMELMLNVLESQTPTAYDILIMKHIQILDKCYCTYPMIATQRKDFSDIENKEMDWGTLMHMTYSMHTKQLPNMAAEIAYCNNGHLINWATPNIDPNLHEIQHPELIGKPCDCGRFTYDEEACGCAIKEWRITWRENTSA